MELIMKVSLHKCENYNNENVLNALKQIFNDFGGINNIVKPNQTVLLKVNLVEKYNPTKACTTHPTIVEELSKLIISCGAKCIIADSPAVFYNKQHVSKVYDVCGMSNASKNSGAILNDNFNSKLMQNPNGKVCKHIEIIDIADKCDVIINVAKFKSHMLTGYTGAVKNLFGLIPGLIKVQMHSNYPNLKDFCNFLIDIEQTVHDKIVFNIIDGVIGMEGAGPTSGTPIESKLIIGCPNAYYADICEVKLMNLLPEETPLLMLARDRGLIDDNFNAEIVGDSLENLKMPHFKNVKVAIENQARVMPKWLQPAFNRLCKKVPIIKAKNCKGCRKCKEHCPNKAIEMKKRKNGTEYAKINYKLCISCFCCQELCPFHVVKPRIPIGYKIIQRKQLKRDKKEKLNNKQNNQ